MSPMLAAVLLQAADEAPELPGGYGVALLQSLLALAAVSVLAWVVLRWAAKRGARFGSSSRVKVLERAGLDARRSLYLVEVGERVLLVGVGDGGPPSLLTEIDPATLPEPAPPAATRFREVLARMAKKPSD
jgi:flagellar protein FliO/FliZ